MANKRSVGVMKRTVLDIISIFSVLLSLSMVSASLYAYLYLKNPENIEKTKGYVKKEMKKMLPELMPKIPTSTGKAILSKPFLK